MLGEYFIDNCITLCCSISDSTKYSRIFEAIMSVMNWYRSEISRDDTPIEFMDKIDLVHYISTYRVHNKSFDFVKMISGMKDGKLKDLIPILEDSRQELTNLITVNCYHINKKNKITFYPISLFLFLYL